MNCNEITVSPDETHHLIRGKRLYQHNFKNVMSFHEPGLASVVDNTGAYHIRPDGAPAYEQRYKKTYGFYCHLASVQDNTGYFHITTNGQQAYDVRFDWVGNFQEKLCTVRGTNKLYHHINKDGSEVYKERYCYAGDFKYGVAVVYNNDGCACHINIEGELIHEKSFIILGVFHKGHAIARDEDGFFHIDRLGNALYSNRYEWVEPFYNDQAFARNFKGDLVVINLNGDETPIVSRERVSR